MKSIYTLEDAVTAYGSEGMIRQLNTKKVASKKKKGSIDGKYTKQLIEKLECKYQSIIVDGRGADRLFICEGEFDEELERLDNRKNNGKGQIPYEEILRNLILLYLKEDSQEYATTTLSVFAHNLGLMSDTLYLASKKTTAKQQIAHYKNLDDKYKIGYSMFWHIVPKESKRIKDHLDSVLKKMNEDEIIYYREVTNVVAIDENGNEEHYPIDNVEAFKIKREQTKLRQKYNITFSDLRHKPHHHKVKAYEEDEKKYFDSIGILYTYDAKIIGLIATDKEIENYMKTSLIIDFKMSHAENTKRLSQKIQDNFYDKLINTKNNEQMVAQFGGRLKPDHALFRGTQYDLVMQDNYRLSYDAIAQAKVAGTYPFEYNDKLKVIQDV